MGSKKIKHPLRVLMSIAKEVSLLHDARGRPFASMQVDGHREVWPLMSKTTKNRFKKMYVGRTQQLPPAAVFSDFLNLLDYKAINETPEKPLWTRVGYVDDAVYIDLCNDNWEVVKITKNGWRIFKKPKAYFYRSNAQQPLPIPKRAKRKKTLRKFMSLLNMNPDDRILVISWLLGSFNVEGPFPLLVLQGEPGSGKTTIARMIQSLVDPSSIDGGDIPRRAEDLMIAAEHSWVLAFDNVSFINDRQSNDFCRLSTGGGGTRRKLYEDSEQVLFTAKRPVIMNGINNIIYKEDLADRAIVVETIPFTKRLSLKALNNEFQSLRPYLFGLICDGISSALANRDKIELPEYPRMADFAIWVCAAEKAVFGKEDNFMKAYNRNRRDQSNMRHEADPVIRSIKEFMKDRNKWKGTSENLLNLLAQALPGGDEGEKIMGGRQWPGASNKLSSRLRLIAPALRQVGFDIQFARTSNARLIILTKVNKVDN